MDYPEKENKPPAENADSFYLKTGSKAFKEMFDNAKVAMMAKHRNGAVHYYVNRSACEMTGYTFAELMNMRFKDLVHSEELGKIGERWERRRKGMELPCCYETRIVTKHGEVIPVEVKVTVGMEKTNSFSFVILRDIRKEKHFEHEMNKSLCMLKEELVKNRSEWESLNMELFQTRHAVSVLANNIDSKKDELEQRVNTTIFSKVMPIIDDLLAEKRVKKFWPEIRSMAEYLKSITTKSKLLLETINLLTDTETKIAALVKNKMSNKEIASAMFISPETVKAHRRNIRKKLKIQNSKLKLSEYLATVMGEEIGKSRSQNSGGRSHPG